MHGILKAFWLRLTNYMPVLPSVLHYVQFKSSIHSSEQKEYNHAWVELWSLENDIHLCIQFVGVIFVKQQCKLKNISYDHITCQSNQPNINIFVIIYVCVCEIDFICVYELIPLAVHLRSTGSSLKERETDMNNSNIIYEVTI